MTTEDRKGKGLTYFFRITLGAALLWSITVIGSASWNVYHERLQTLDLAQKEALSNFNKDLAFRLWGTKHGGVYVPPTEQTPPNPYLGHIPDRDITLPSGKRLTLMNPAYMVRQMMADFNEYYGVKGRITSLNPLNPNNAPDAWEREALAAFEQGVKEVFVITEQDGQKSLRLMRPLEVKTGCLKCHASQGYKEGDIRGGVGVMVPMAPYLMLEKKTIDIMIISHLVIWLLGSILLGLVYYWGRRFIQGQEKDKAALQESEMRFRRFYEQVPLPLCYINKNGELVYLNERFVQVFGYTLDDVPTLKEWWQQAYPEEDYRRWVLANWEEAVAKAVKQGTEIEPVEYRVTCKNGAKREVLIGGITLEENVLATFVDLTERNQAEHHNALMMKQFKVLWEISRMLDADMKAICNVAQEKILEVTGSDYAFYGFLNKEETVLTIGSWSKEAMAACDVGGNVIEYPIADSGLWGNAVRERRTIVINDYAVDHAGKKGLPEGHVMLTRILVVPVFGEEGRIAAVAAVANKHSDYLEEDSRQVEGIMGSVQLLVARKKAEEALQKLNEKLEGRVTERTAELAEKNRELERMNNIFVGRELRMVELKERVQELEKKLQEKLVTDKTAGE